MSSKVALEIIPCSQFFSAAVNENEHDAKTAQDFLTYEKMATRHNFIVSVCLCVRLPFRFSFAFHVTFNN